MNHISRCLLAIMMLLLSSCGPSKELTRSKAKDILNKVVAEAKITRITLSPDNRPPANLKGGPDVTGMATCLPDRTDIRVGMGFALCSVGMPEITWQRPGTLLVLNKPVTLTIVEVTGIADETNPKEKIVEYTWQYDLSPLTKQTQDAVKIVPHPGKALLRLYDDGWRFVDFK